MAVKGIATILSGYFNQSEGRVAPTQFLRELKDLSPVEKYELALGVCEITGDTIKDAGLK